LFTGILKNILLKPVSVKINSLAFIFILSMVFFACNKEEDALVNADVKIDSLSQDDVIFGEDTIPGNLHVFYSVTNNNFDDIHSFVFTINATNVNSSSYSIIERSDNGVSGNSVLTGEVIMGIGEFAVQEVQITNEKFE
jgi:hypothetical protein